MSSSHFGTIANDVQEEITGTSVPPELLWHYTSSSGLLGIIESNTLRFSDSIFMNDGSELIHGLQLLNLVIEEFVNDKPEDHKAIASRLMNLVAQTLDQSGSIIFCMCEESNLLNQWRDYGRDVVPYCIGFDSGALLIPGEYNFDSYLVNVIYDIDVQRRILRTLCERIYEMALKIPNVDSIDENEAEPYYIDAAIQFSSIILRLKNPAFAAEKEWRLIAHRPDVSRRVKQQFRASPLGVIPFYEWNRRGRERQLPIRQVVVGPSPYGQISDLALKQFLRERGYEDTATFYSKIPIRK